MILKKKYHIFISHFINVGHIVGGNVRRVRVIAV